MLSKAKGQILQVAAIFNVLFAIRNVDDKFEAILPPHEISESAITTAIDFI